jgi:hypothetical protein
MLAAVGRRCCTRLLYRDRPHGAGGWPAPGPARLRPGPCLLTGVPVETPLDFDCQAAPGSVARCDQVLADLAGRLRRGVAALAPGLLRVLQAAGLHAGRAQRTAVLSGLLREPGHVRQARSRHQRRCRGLAVITHGRPPHRARSRLRRALCVRQTGELFAHLLRLPRSLEPFRPRSLELLRLVPAPFLLVRRLQF